MNRPTPIRRVGSRQLSRLTSQLSERDLEVIRGVEDLRFLTSRQVQRLWFGIGEHTELGAARCSRRTLERLHRFGLLHRLDRRVGGVRAGSAGFVYCLGPVGQQLVRAKHRRHVREPSTTFLDHNLAVAEVVVTIIEATRHSQLELVGYQTEPDCWRPFSGIGGAREILKPDLRLTLALHDYEHHWFIEVDLGSEHRPAVERKCGAYERYLRSGVEQQRHGVFPRVAWLTRDEVRADRLRLIIHDQQGTEGLFVVGRLDEPLHTLAGDPS